MMRSESGVHSVIIGAALVLLAFGSAAAGRGQEIQIEGVDVVTTETDQDTTYSAGDGLELHGQTFRSVLAGKMCPRDSVVVGFDASGQLVCSCAPGLGLTQCPSGCVDLLSDDDNCGDCEVVCEVDTYCLDGACRACDPVVQDCAVSGEGCYVFLTTGESHCAIEYLENPPATQGYICSAINACAIGYGCVLVHPTLSELTCARFCDPDDLDGPNGHARCEADVETGFRCVRATDFYPSGTEDSTWIGFCIGPEWEELPEPRAKPRARQ